MSLKLKMRQKQLQRYLNTFFVLIVILVVLGLYACEDPDAIKGYEPLEMDFLALQYSNGTAYAYYESPEDKEYYKIEIDSYQYNNWKTSGYPDHLKLIREKSPMTGFSGTKIYDILILSDLDKEKDKDFKDVDIETLSYEDMTNEMYLTEYWADIEEPKSEEPKSEEPKSEEPK